MSLLRPRASHAAALIRRVVGARTAARAAKPRARAIVRSIIALCSRDIWCRLNKREWCSYRRRTMLMISIASLASAASLIAARPSEAGTPTLACVDTY